MTQLPASAAVLDFPLRGEWRATNTPAERVPSHGTDFFAQRYAIDFVQMDDSGSWYYPPDVRALLRHLTIGVPAELFFCWSRPVLSASGGRVVAVHDGWPDRLRVSALWELARATIAPPGIGRDGDHRPLAGNFVVVESAEGFAFYAHLRCGSIRVRPGDDVAPGDPLGTVGNSGNSTMPHLHFHLMDGPDALTARGLPCEFRGYERWVEGAWRPVDRGIPGSFERVRAG